MACTHENVFVHGEMGDFQWCKDCGSTRFVEDGDVWDPPRHTQLLQFLRRRLRQTMQDGFELPLLEMDRHAMSRDAVRGGHKIIARGQMDIFAEIIRYLHTELGMSSKHAPYVLQAWVDGVYHYYAKTEWTLSVSGARTFQALTEAEAFIMQNFNPDVARDSILIVPLKEALER
jgi:hypothetical protein